MRQTRSASLSLLLTAALWLGACTSDNPDANLNPPGTDDMSVQPQPDDGGATQPDMTTANPDQGGPVGDVNTECTKLATAICTRLSTCSAWALRYYYGDLKGCVARVQLTCAPYVNLTGSSWTVDRLRSCTAAYTSGTCGDYFDPAGPAACRPQPGKLANGVACANSNQCQSGFCTAALNSCGTCAVPAKSGEACSATKLCGLGLSCAGGKCAPYGAVGAACGNNLAPCATNLYCKTNVCAAQLAAGDTCNAASTVTECNPIQGLFCNGTTRKCEAYKLAAATEACGTVMASTVLCDTGGYCTGTGAANRKCAPAAKEGQPCGPTSAGESCQDPAVCTGAKCAVFNPSTCK